MTPSVARIALTAFAAKVAGFLPSGCTGAGEPLRWSRRVINGHLVQVEVIGHAGERTDITLPYETGTRPLELDEAASLVAA